MTNDLGLVVASNDEHKFWLDVKESTERQIKDLKNQLMLTEAMLTMVTQKADDAEADSIR